MPVVRAQRSVTPAPLPGYQRTAAETPESLGAGVEQAKARTAQSAAGLANRVSGLATSELQRIAEEEHAFQIARSDLQDDRELGQLRLDLLKGDGGYLTLEGGQALQADAGGMRPDAAVLEKWRQGADRIYRSRSRNPQEELNFQRRRVQQEESLDQAVSEHYLAQSRTFAREELDAELSNLQTSAGLELDAPDRVAGTLAKGAGRIREIGPQLGMGPEAITAAIQKFVTGVHVDQVRLRLAAGKTFEAAGYFQAVQEQLRPDVRADLEKAVNTGKELALGQSMADHIRATHLPDVPLSTWLDAIPKDADPDVRARAVEELRLRDGVRRQEQQQHDENLYRDLYNRIDAGQPIDPTQLAQLAPAEQSALRTYRLRRAKGEPIETDWNVYSDLMDLVPDRGQFATVNLRRYRPWLSDEDYSWFERKQLDLREDRPDSVRAATIDSNQFNVIAEAAGLKPYSSLEPDRNRIGRLRNAVEAEIDREQRRPGQPSKELTRDQKGAIMQRVVDEHVLVGWTTRPAAAVLPDEQKRARVKLAEIPADALAGLVNIARSLSPRAQRETQDQIVDRWQDRFERAYAARVLHLGEDAVRRILAGQD